MTLRFEKFIIRAMLRAERQTLFAFGDNIKGGGFGGQAKEMRGEPNAVGIPTKWAPTNRETAFFCDDDLPVVRGLIEQRLRKLAEHLNQGGDVVWPADGIGTGLAELEARAPRIKRLIDTWLESMKAAK